MAGRKMKLLLLLLFIIPIPLFAAEKKKPITPEDIVQIRQVADPQISPDGKWVVFVVREPSGKKQPQEMMNSEIWIAPSDGSIDPRKFAFGPKKESMPRWSPDGSHLAFLSDRHAGGKNQIYVMSVSGGEAEPITEMPEGVEDFQWLAGSSAIAFTSKDALAAEEQKRRAEGDDEIVLDDTIHYSRLYEMDLKSRVLKTVTLPDENVNEFDYSPDGFSALISISKTPKIDDVYFHSSLVILKTTNHSRTVLQEKCYGTIRWSPDGSRILFFAPTGKGIASFPNIISVSGGSATQFAENYPGVIWEMDWLPDGRILISAQEGAQGILGFLRTNPFRIDVLSGVERPFDDPGNWSVNADGQRIAFLDAAVDSPNDVWTIKTDGTERKRISEMNPQLKSLAFGTSEVIEWKSKDGTSIEGILFKPAGYVPGKRYPLVVQVHGGPDWCWWKGWHASWHEWAQLLASNGYAVLLPNPRGSFCYGWKFSEANANDWGGGDFQDIMAGSDSLVQNGIADPDHLGIGGWSYGGFMTAWAITQTQRFKAAVMGAGLSNITSQYGTHDIPTFTKFYFGASPYDNKALYEQRSPIYFLQNVTTPTLILHGEEDLRVPSSQGLEFYQGLRDRKVPVQFVIYPREPHTIGEQMHQQDLLQRVLNWFDKYLK